MKKLRQRKSIKQSGKDYSFFLFQLYCIISKHTYVKEYQKVYHPVWHLYLHLVNIVIVIFV